MLFSRGLASPERLIFELEGDVFIGLPQRVDLFNKLMFFATSFRNCYKSRFRPSQLTGAN